MKTDTALLLRAASALLLIPVAAYAQPAGQATVPAHRSQGSVTLQQFVQRHEKKLMAADTNGDGRISKAEFLAAAKPGKGNPERRFARFDLNHDGMLDKSEIDAMLAKRFKRLDTNGDGVLSADERAAAHGGARGAPNDRSDT